MSYILLLALLTGIVVGLLFTGLKIPLPAPDALAGVMGIFGLFLGSKMWPYIAKLFS